ncbi:hypothetical protein halTADL_2407 [Halohasta litchfieldiae]|uniref:Uncharacterized protein n=1 Tax=Halohasta litchfieldiae TaxID=1073996 RepID=A0A1H6XMB1_9EURY|nr:hypothetical protein halTADL_2407 [Halohasta litchfieldiae]SEJ29306.1 hypothetical protein SAMN05444271_1414 [Halohasta litchfieldiae]
MEASLRSLDLYLQYPAGAVVKTRELRDVGCGMYLTYYTVVNDEIWASTSASNLVFALGELEPNETFDPPNFFDEQPIMERLLPSLPPGVVEHTPAVVGQLLRSVGLLSEKYWDDSIETIDKRVTKLRPFERRTATSSSVDFSPTFRLSDPAEFVTRSATHITEFINTIEKQFPNHHHIARVGGMDSQLLLLAPKVTDNWHVFSAEPNYPIVKDFVEENDISVQNVFRHDNQNEETDADLKRKLICSDLRTDPRHLRWYPTLEQLVDRFDGKVIFWCGTEGDTIYSYHADYQAKEGTAYFDLHQSRAANWQSVTHQVTKNYTGAAALSPYHSEEIWSELYRHYDPNMIDKGTDLRYELGEELAGRSVTWPTSNPGPAPYTYDIVVDPRELYTEYIHGVLNGEHSQLITENRGECLTL